MDMAIETSLAAVEIAFRQLEAAIYRSDAQLFHSTTLQDVKDAVKIIERGQEQRKCLRNLRRIEPLFRALDRFGGAIDTLCQGTPYLCFIWAPLKLVLQIADEYTSGFEKLVDAYSQIALHLPRFDRLSNAFRNQPDFQSILADVYTDLLNFHLHAYKFLRRSGWKHLFDATWKDFGSRFRGILQNLARNRDLVDKEAASFEILESKSYRLKVLDEIEQAEGQRRDWQLRDTIAWLDLRGYDREQAELLDRNHNARLAGTCEWILQHPSVISWLDENDQHSILWLKGKPGAGKSIISSHLIKTAPLPPRSLMLYWICAHTYDIADANICSLILRNLLAQILRSKHELLPYVYDTYVKQGHLPTLVRSREILKDILSSFGTTFMIVDGLDEYEAIYQKQILNELFNLLRLGSNHNPAAFRILLCSRETKDILPKLRKFPQIYLSDEQHSLSRDIAAFVRASIAELRDRFENDIVDNIGEQLVSKSDGMFLWVRLVLNTVLEQESIGDLRSAVDRLPHELDAAYEIILRRIASYSDSDQRLKAQRILGWIAYGYRPLRSYEICDGLALHAKTGVLDETTKLGKGVLDVCKPMIEEQQGNIILLVHFTAREYLLRSTNGLFVSPLKAHADIVISCLKYLLTCTVFTVVPLSVLSKIQIAKGYHNLFPYAQEFWLDHLLAFEAADVQDESYQESHREVGTLLSKLMVFRKDHTDSKVEELSAEGMPSETPVIGDIQEEAGVSFAQYHSNVPEFIQKIILFRRKSPGYTNSSANDYINADLKRDPTALSLAYRSYRTAFESLFENSVSLTCQQLGLSTTDIESFRNLHSDAVYLCVFRGCTRASTGFRTTSELKKHQAFHERPFRCAEISCELYAFGFASRRALQGHVSKYHTKLESITVPKFGERGVPPSLEIEPLATSESLLPSGVTVPGDDFFELDPDQLPEEFKFQDQGWFAVFNPAVPRKLDVKLQHTLFHADIVCSICFSADGEFIATGSDRIAEVFDCRDGGKVCELEHESASKDDDLYIRSVCFHPDGKLLATGAEDRKLRVWDIEEKRIRYLFDGHEQDIYSIDFTSDGKKVVSASGDKTVRVWDIEANQQTMVLCIDDGATSVKTSPDGQLIAVGSIDKSVSIWDLSSGVLVKRVEGHKDGVYAVAFTPNGRELVSGSLDKTAAVWDLIATLDGGPNDPTDAFKRLSLEGHKDYVLCVCVTPDNKWILSAGKDKEIVFWDQITGEAQMRVCGHKNSVISIATSPKGNTFATASGDRKATIWKYWGQTTVDMPTV